MKLKIVIVNALVICILLFSYSSCKKKETLAASFTIKGGNQPAPDTVFFTNTSTDANTYVWDFGDNGTSTDTNPVHIYAAKGTYTVVLYAYSGTKIVQSSQTVTVLTPADQYLCTGKSGNNAYFPLAIGNQWSEYGLGGTDVYSVVDTTPMNGYTYFHVSIYISSTQSNNDRYFRVDASGNIYEYLGSGEDLFLPGNPTVSQDLGQSVNFDGFNYDCTVASLNASVSTSSCTYTNCLEIQYSGGAEYFVKGLGCVKTGYYQLTSAIVK